MKALALALVVATAADVRPAGAPVAELPMWPGFVSVLTAIPAVLGGLVAFTQVKSCPGCTSDPVMSWTAAEGFGLAAILLLGGIVFAAIVQHHNAQGLPDPQE